MKILHVIESGGFYGAERVLVELVLGLRELKHDSIVLSIGRTPNIENELEKVLSRYAIQFIPLRISIKDSLFINRKVLAYTQQYSCDLVHSHSYKSNIVLSLISKSKRPVPFCCTVHGYVKTKKISRMRLYQWLDKISLRYMQHVFLVSRQMKTLPSINTLETSKYSVIENGIGGYKPKQSEIDPYVLEFIAGKDCKFMAVGRLALEKGFDLLIRSISVIIKGDKTAVLVIFGDGPEKNTLQELINQLNLEKNVLLCGYSPDVTCYFNYFDSFVMPSITEGAPISLLEAMYAEMNCAATKVGSIPNMLNNGKVGHLFEANSVGKLTARLENMKSHKGAAARVYAMEHYTYIKMTSSYLKVYMTLSLQH